MDTDEVTGDRFVAYLQNHDQIGNRAQGDRLAMLLSPGLLRVGGGAPAHLALHPDAVHGGGVGGVDAPGSSSPVIPSPSWPPPSPPAAGVSSPGTAGRPDGYPTRRTRRPSHRSQLDWSELDKPAHQEMLGLHRELIALRRSRPELSDPRLAELEVCHGDGHLVIHRGGCRVVANLAGRPQRVELAATVRAVLLSTGPGVTVMRGAVQLPPETAAVVTV